MPMAKIVRQWRFRRLWQVWGVNTEWMRGNGHPEAFVCNFLCHANNIVLSPDLLSVVRTLEQATAILNSSASEKDKKAAFILMRHILGRTVCTRQGVLDELSESTQMLQQLLLRLIGEGEGKQESS